jgi:hypothetical protein
MAKPAKSFEKQAEKAEQVANLTRDSEHADRMRSLAHAFRAQAEVIKSAGKSKAKKTKKNDQH